MLPVFFPFPPPLRGRIKEGGFHGYHPPIPAFPRKEGRSSGNSFDGCPRSPLAHGLPD